MSRTWKWIIGIGLTLSVLALAVVPFIFRIGMRAMPLVKQGVRMGRQFPDRMHDFGMMGGIPGMIGITNVLLPILVIALMLFIGYLIGSAKKPTTPAVVSPAPAVSPDGLKPCAHCGQNLEPSWTHCPFCGTQING